MIGEVLIWSGARHAVLNRQVRIRVRVRPGKVAVQWRDPGEPGRKYSRWIEVLHFSHAQGCWMQPGFSRTSEAGICDRMCRATVWPAVRDAIRLMSPDLPVPA